MKMLLVTFAATTLATLALPRAGHAQGYGQSVLVAGDQVLVGQSLDAATPGYVFVYRRNGAGEWTQASRLEASDAEPNDHFGRALAFAQGDLLVGATIARQSGALYVFSPNPDGTWRETASMVASDADSSHSFGRVAASDGRTVLMSDWAARDSRGAVYVFEKRDGAWRETARLLDPDGQPNDWFGFSAAVDGDRIAVGVVNRNQHGEARVFRRQGDGWTQVARIEAPDTTANLQFGNTIALAGDALLVGAPGADGFVGAVYTYRGNADGSQWTPTGKVSPPQGTPPTNTFPAAIESAGDAVWVGFPGFQTGRVARLDRAGDGAWQLGDALPTDGLEPGDGFGAAFSIRGDLAAVAALGDDFGLGSVAVLGREGGRWAMEDLLIGDPGVDLDPITGGKVDCTSGRAASFDCEGVDILSFLPVSEIGGGRGVQVNDVWGWTDPRTGHEWALVGRYDGTSFIDVSDPSNPRYVGDLPLHEGARPNVWRDIKVYRDHAYIVSDGAGPHGMQVFDLNRLRDVPAGEPVTFTEDAHYDRIASAHNIVINEETGFAYAVGASSGGETCGGGLHMIDIREPKQPVFAGCFQDTETGNQRTGYSHDAQCVVYNGPDEQYRGREICFGSNETALSIADVTDKEKPIALSRAAYPNVGYAHQGWLDEEQQYFYMNDEGDETNGTVPHTRTLVWDVKDLDDPILAKEYFGPSTSSDHNLYVVGNLMYQSNYVSGLRIVDISNRAEPHEVGFFDTVTGNDAPGFDGSWSNFPFFDSGTIVVTSGREGVFFLRRQQRPIS